MNESNIEAKCAHCKHRVEVPMPPPNIGRQSLCFFLPPIPCVAFGAAPGGQVAVLAQASVRPVVRDEDTCAQFEPRPALTLLPAND